MTSPYLAAKVEQYNTHRKAVEDVRDLVTREGREATETEMRTVVEHGEAGQELYTQIAELQAEELRHAKVTAMAARVDQALQDDNGSRQDTDAGDGMWSLVPDREQLAQLRSAALESRPLRLTTARLPRDVHTRAAVTLSLTGGRIGGMSGRLPEPRRLARAVGLVPETSSTAGVSGPKFGATTAAAPTAEGAAKPEAATITKLDIAVKQLARWTTVSRMALGSTPDFMEQLVSWHAMFVAKDEDKMLIDALNTAAGAAIAFVADVRANVRGAMAKVEDAVSAACDVVLVHPDNFALLGAYEAISDDAGEPVTRFGTGLLYVSSAVPTGFALVAALRASGAFIMADPPAVASTQALSTNEVTVRTEELAGFDVRLVGAVAKVDIVTP